MAFLSLYFVSFYSSFLAFLGQSVLGPKYFLLLKRNDVFRKK